MPAMAEPTPTPIIPPVLRPGLDPVSLVTVGDEEIEADADEVEVVCLDYY
jgi:hypothetical protein